jgi:hypothetical protein
MQNPPFGGGRPPVEVFEAPSMMVRLIASGVKVR